MLYGILKASYLLKVSLKVNVILYIATKFTVGYFRVKTVCGNIFSSLRVSDEIFLTTNYY